MGPDVLMQDGIITHRFTVAQDDKFNGSLETGKKSTCFTQIGNQILRWEHFRDSWMHRLSQMSRGRRSLSMHGCHAVSDEEIVGFIDQCTMSFITTPKPFSQWGMGNEGRYMLRHVDGQTSLLHYSQMLHRAGILFSFHNICRLYIFPKDSTGMDVPTSQTESLVLTSLWIADVIQMKNFFLQ